MSKINRSKRASTIAFRKHRRVKVAKLKELLKKAKSAADKAAIQAKIRALSPAHPSLHG